MHTLLAEFARLQDRDLEESALPAVAEAIALLASRALINRSLECLSPLHEHLETLAKFAGDANLQITSALLGNLGVYLGRLAEYESAKMYLERCLEIDKSVYDQDDPRMAIDSNNLGTVLLNWVNYRKPKSTSRELCRSMRESLAQMIQRSQEMSIILEWSLKTWEICGKPGRASREL